MGEEGTAKKVCHAFLNRSASTTANLAKAYEDKNCIDLRRYAHSLKGACGYICSEGLKASALGLQLACEEVNDGRTIGMQRVEECYHKLTEELDIVIGAMRAHMATIE